MDKIEFFEQIRNEMADIMLSDEDESDAKKNVLNKLLENPENTAYYLMYSSPQELYILKDSFGLIKNQFQNSKSIKQAFSKINYNYPFTCNDPEKLSINEILKGHEA